MKKLLVTLLAAAALFGVTAVSAENTVYTADDVEALISAIPKYTEQYYTEESAAALDLVLAAIDTEALDSYDSEQLTYFYNELSETIAALSYKTAEVPQVYITTENGDGNTIVKSTGYVNTAIAIVDVDGETIEEQQGEIKVRGNSTAAAPKKPFTIKLSSKKNVLGMGKSKKWILLANCFDPTLMRNYLVFDLAKTMELAYTTEQEFVELWVDGVFKGCYLLVEQVEVGSTRVDIDISDNTDFLLEYEYQREESDVAYVTSNGFRFAVSEPEMPDTDASEEELSAYEAEISYIQETMDEITTAIIRKNYSEIEKYIDIESFTKFYVLNEYYKPVDFGYSSVFFYYKDGKLYAGPVWDYDLSSGNINADYSTGYAAAQKSNTFYAKNQQLFYHLYQCEEFKEQAIEVYKEYRPYIESVYEENGLIDEVLSNYANVFSRNYNEAGWDVSYAYSTFERIPEETFEENVEFLANWLKERNEWLLEKWGIVIKVGAEDVYYNGEAYANAKAFRGLQASGGEEITIKLDNDGEILSKVIALTGFEEVNGIIEFDLLLKNIPSSVDSTSLKAYVEQGE